MLFLTETRRSSRFSTGDILFTSETNSVNAKFTSDDSVRESGFTLDVQSIPCSDRDTYPQHSVCDDYGQGLNIAPGEVLQAALVTDTDDDGNYPNNACQNWYIVANEDQVHVMLKK